MLVFVGTTPADAAVRERPLQISVPRGCTKAKWRIALYQDAATRAPTTYRIEGSLFRQGAAEGRWSIARDGSYRLEHSLHLRKGDDDVLYILDRSDRPLVGHEDFSDTLDRRR